ncbi:hypothetical protein GCM10023168_11170 [Fodinibacter luteus]|uniref:HNH nuclease domain-containing protein n=1 Tax=Fodinibacter luteus TaxID=552064 RepID=A0ABP8K7C2_9MICO
MELADGAGGRWGVGGSCAADGPALADGPEGVGRPGVAPAAELPGVAGKAAPVLPSGLPAEATAWLADVHARAASPASGLPSAEWVGLVAQCQAVVNSLTAAQDAALARLACIEVELAEDGTLVERAHPLGHQALDAPDLAAPALAATHQHAARRMGSAVRWAADGPSGSSSSTGLAGLHEAMRAGRLDGYRAGVVADELDLAPPQVAAAVVEALQEYFERETGGDLRRRVRQVLARICPDLLVERARRARARSGLRRWVDEPGLDRWDGTFPSEEAAGAWAAIDALAQQYVADGVCQGIERARAKALTDLVTGNATVEAVLSLTTPADLPTDEPAAQPRGAGAPTGSGDEPDLGTAGERETGGASERETGGASERETGGASEPAAERETLDDLDAEPHSDVPGPEPMPARNPRSPEGGSAEGGRSISDDDLVEVQGSRPFEPLLVPRGWLRGLGRAAPGAASPPWVIPFVCHPVTGALTDPEDTLATGGYRPSARLAAFVRARDGRCRFPGCSVAARFCDLDHVRPWPLGPTAARNLMAVCRRHHRIKQRPGWRVRLRPDAVATWTDPTGRVRSTNALNRLTPVVLPATPVGATDPAPAPCCPGDDWQPQGALDLVLEHAVATAHPPLPPCATAVRVDLALRTIRVDVGSGSGCRSRTRRPGRTQRRNPDDDPPF